MRMPVRRMSSLDPIDLRDPSSVLIARQLFDTLVGYDPRTLALTPRLASAWESLDGGARYLFHLRPDVRFHNGREIGADDVVFALNRLASKQAHSELALLLDQVVGFESFNRTGTAPTLEGIRSIDPATVEIRLKSRWIEFPYVLTNVATAPVPAELVQAPESFKLQPVGSGPYRLGSPLKAGDDNRLVAFTGYWDKKPSIRSVKLLSYDQISSAWPDFESGALDVSEVPVPDIASARARYGDAGFSPLAASIFIGINSKLVPDVRLRQAVSSALDRAQICSQIFGGALTPSRSIIPRALSVGTPPTCGAGCGPDLQKAKSLSGQLSSSAAALTYDFQNTPHFGELAAAIQKQLSSADITVAGRPMDLADLSNTLNASGSQMFNIGWVGEFPSMQWFLDPLLRSSSADNHIGYRSSQIDAALDAAKAEEDPKVRAAIYRTLETSALGDAVIIPLGEFSNRYAASSRLRGFYVDETGGFSLQKMSMDAR